MSGLSGFDIVSVAAGERFFLLLILLCFFFSPFGVLCIRVHVHSHTNLPSPSHSAAVDSSGLVWVWGRGLEFQLGLGDTYARTSPSVVPGLPFASKVFLWLLFVVVCYCFLLFGCWWWRSIDLSTPPHRLYVRREVPMF